ncbi:MAG: response regulator transcription factor [Bryobacteraceae bacterium]
MTRVFVLAESFESAESLAALVADDGRLEVAGTASLGRFERALLIETRPDVVLASRIPSRRLDQIDLPIVLLTDEPLESWDFSSNVRARLPVHVTPAEAFAALIAAGQGLTVLTAAQAETVLNLTPAPNSDSTLLVERLTPREIEVLRMMGQGVGNKEIADGLGISENTVKFHVASILGKLNAASRTEAVARGIRTGLIPI